MKLLFQNLTLSSLANKYSDPSTTSNTNSNPSSTKASQAKNGNKFAVAIEAINKGGTPYIGSNETDSSVKSSKDVKTYGQNIQAEKDAGTYDDSWFDAYKAQMASLVLALADFGMTFLPKNAFTTGGQLVTGIGSTTLDVVNAAKYSEDGEKFSNAVNAGLLGIGSMLSSFVPVVDKYVKSKKAVDAFATSCKWLTRGMMLLGVPSMIQTYQELASSNMEDWSWSEWTHAIQMLNMGFGQLQKIRQARLRTHDAEYVAIPIEKIDSNGKRIVTETVVPKQDADKLLEIRRQPGSKSEHLESMNNYMAERYKEFTPDGNEGFKYVIRNPEGITNYDVRMDPKYNKEYYGDAASNSEYSWINQLQRPFEGVYNRFASKGNVYVPSDSQTDWGRGKEQNRISTAGTNSVVSKKSEEAPLTSREGTFKLPEGLDKATTPDQPQQAPQQQKPQSRPKQQSTPSNTKPQNSHGYNENTLTARVNESGDLELIFTYPNGLIGKLNPLDITDIKRGVIYTGGNKPTATPGETMKFDPDTNILNIHGMNIKVSDGSAPGIADWFNNNIVSQRNGGSIQFAKRGSVITKYEDPAQPLYQQGNSYAVGKTPEEINGLWDRFLETQPESHRNAYNNLLRQHAVYKIDKDNNYTYPKEDGNYDERGTFYDLWNEYYGEANKDAKNVSIILPRINPNSGEAEFLTGTDDKGGISFLRSDIGIPSTDDRLSLAIKTSPIQRI